MSAIDGVEVGPGKYFAGYGPFTPLYPLPVPTQDLLLEALAALRAEVEDWNRGRATTTADDALLEQITRIADEIEALG